MVFIKKVSNSDPGDADHVGGNNWDSLDDYFADVATGLTAAINSSTTFRDNVLKLRNPANTFSYTMRSGAITGNRDLNFPITTGTDTLATLSLPQTFSNKTLDNTCSVASAIGVSAGPTYVIEPTNANIDASNGFKVTKMFKGSTTSSTYTTNVTTMFDDILDQMTRPTASSSTMKGGTLFLKNGTYTLETSGIIAGDSTDGANVHLRLIGESRERTIIKTGFSGTGDSITPHCHLDVENITINGNNQADIGGINVNTGDVATKILKVKNCRFTNIHGFNIFCGDTTYGVDVSECTFDTSQVAEDLFALEASNFAHIHHNIFDRRAGVTDWEMLTSGSLKNANINDNIFLGLDHVNAISLEGFNAHNNYDNVLIHGNLCENTNIVIGSSGAWSETFRNMAIMNNHLHGGTITVYGPSTGSYTDLIKYINIENNTLIDSWHGGINIVKVDGYCTVRNNSIKNSNISSDSFPNDKGGITLEKSRDVVCTNNFIYMGVVSPEDADVSPYGIKHIDLINPTIINNRVVNRTVANPDIVSEGTNTGTIRITDNS